MKRSEIVTLEDLLVRLPAARQPNLDATTRVAETARRLEDLGKQQLILDAAKAEGLARLASQENDQRQTLAAFEKFLEPFSPTARLRLLEGRVIPKPPKKAEAEMTDRERLVEEFRAGRHSQLRLLKLTKALDSGMTLEAAKKSLENTSAKAFRWDPVRGQVPDG